MSSHCRVSYAAIPAQVPPHAATGKIVEMLDAGLFRACSGLLAVVRSSRRRHWRVEQRGPGPDLIQSSPPCSTSARLKG
jgi:hypothetical protein